MVLATAAAPHTPRFERTFGELNHTSRTRKGETLYWNVSFFVNNPTILFNGRQHWTVCNVRFIVHPIAM